MAYQFVGAKADPLARKGLSEVKSQLADLLNQMTIKSNHVFADTTTRDDYFSANPDELKDGLIIVVGTEFQKRIEDTWITVTSVVSTLHEALTEEDEDWEVE